MYEICHLRPGISYVLMMKLRSSSQKAETQWEEVSFKN